MATGKYSRRTLAGRARHRVCVIAGLLVVGATASAQQALNVHDAVERALHSRPELDISRGQVGSAVARFRQAESGLRPSFFIQGVATQGPPGAPGFGPLNNPALLGTTPLGLQGIAANPLKKQFGFGLTMTQTLFDFGRTEHLSSARSLLVKSANQEFTAQAAVVVLTVEERYARVLEAQELEKAFSLDVIRRQETLSQAKAFLDAELRSGVEFQIARANLAASQTALAGAVNNVRFAFAQLNHSMGATSMTAYNLEPFVISSNEILTGRTADGAMNFAAKYRPEVLQAGNQSFAAQDMAKALQSDLMPRLDTVASLGAVRPSDLMNSNKNYALGIVLSIPLSTGGFVEGRIEEEKQKAKAARSQERVAIELVKLQAAKAWLDLDTRRAELTSAKAQLEAAVKARDLASQRYRLQLSTMVELSEAEALLVRAETQVVSATTSVQIAQAVLSWATGLSQQGFKPTLVAK